MTGKKIIITSLFALFCNLLYPQQSMRFLNPQRHYEKALNLFNDGQYAASQLEFEKVLKQNNSDSNLKLQASYYSALSSIKLGDKNADVQMQKFVDENSTSPFKNKACLDIAQYYYDQGKYKQSLEWYDRLDQNDLPKNIREEFIFKKSFAQYSDKQYQKAQLGFSKLFESAFYQSQAKYYFAHIAYLQENNQLALKYFLEVKDEEKYTEQVPFFVAQIYFNMQDYQKAVETGLPLVKDAKSAHYSDMSKLIGDSYFNISDFKNAVIHLLNYQGVKGKYNNSHFYQLGYSYYQIGIYDSAISFLNKIVNSGDEMAQNAFYTLGSSYLKLGQKNEALSAFRRASEMDFNKKVQEDAFYLYAKLSYDVGNVAEMPAVVINRYLLKYPNSIQKNEVYEMLVNSYLLSNNYKEVMSVLDSADLSNYKLKVVYQKAAYLQGVEFFIDGKFWDAKKYFEISLEKGFDKNFRNKATYWIGECYFNIGEYEQALAFLKSYEMNQSENNSYEAQIFPYSLGYVYFKLKNYPFAVKEFEKFSKGKLLDDKIKNDNLLRLGDSYFANGQYWPALENYNKSLDLKISDQDYAVYQKAVCYGLLGKNDQRISTLNSLLEKYPKSKIGDDALYLLGAAYTLNNDNSKALNSYQSLLKKYPGSSFVPKAKLNMALIYFNSNKNDLALEQYKQVVASYPASKEAMEAVAGAKKIYIDMGDANSYLAWVNTLDFIDISQSEADSTQYIAAEKAFLKADYERSISSFEEYLQKYPKGNSRLSAHYYLAQSYLSKQNKDKALVNLEEVLKFEKNEFTEGSLIWVSSAYLERGDSSLAMTAFEKLVLTAENEQNRNHAEYNLMRLYDAAKMSDKALQSAMLISVNSKADERIKSEALLIIGRIAFERGEFEMAKEYYSKLEPIAKGEMKAESLYYKAYYLNNQGQFQESNQVVFEIASKYSGYKYWGAKSLLIMARNFSALNDQYQAIYTLETVLKKFDFEDVKIQAQQMLDQIKEQSTTIEESNNSSN